MAILFMPCDTFIMHVYLRTCSTTIHFLLFSMYKFLMQTVLDYYGCLLYSFIFHMQTDAISPEFLLGTDTTGDLRIPASFCGVLCFRPSHGVVSTLGTLPNSHSLDTIGIFLPLSIIYVFMFITYCDKHIYVFYSKSCLYMT